MVNHQFRLKRSILALLFQLSVLMVLWVIWLSLFSWIAASGLILASLISFMLFFRRAYIIQIQYLTEKYWSVQLSDSPKILQLHLDKVIDHQFYMILLFKDYQDKPVIWLDQVSLQEWKKLKVMAKLL